MRNALVSLHVACLVLLLGVGAPATAAPDGFKKTLKAYRRQAKNPSFYRRMMAHEGIARTKDPRALAALIKNYARPPAPRAQSQYVMAAVGARYFDQPTFLSALKKWREKYQRPEHAWLWYQTLLLEGQQEGAQGLVALARSNKSAFLRAAAVEALADLRLPEAVVLVPSLLATLPTDKAQRTALLNSLVSVLLSRSHEDGSPAHQGLARQLMDQLDNPATSAQSKVVIARHLQRAFDVPHAFTAAGPWRQVLASVQSLMEIPQLTGAEVKPVQLAGVKARGNRICYVIDYSSGASLETSSEDEAILRGQGDGAAGGKGEPPSGGRLRVLALREAVATSIKALSPEQSFAVIYHRHLSSGLVPGCKGLMRATPKNVAAVLAGLKTLAPAADSDLHAGLLRAFGLKETGFSKGPEYVDPAVMLEGCDTVFVLSQSGSVRDTWVATGDSKSEPKRWSYEDREIRGIYSDEAYLSEELHRWNLFRKAEIHSVAIAEAPREVLQGLLRPYRGWRTLKETEAKSIDEEAAGEVFSAVTTQYNAYMKRPSLFMRMRGRRRLASTRDPRALDILARSYARPESPEHRVPHILVSLCSRHFGQAKFLPRFHEWRGAHTEAKDAWLWYRSAQLDLLHGDPLLAEALVQETGTHYLKLATIRAIASQRKPVCVPLAGRLLAALPEGGSERASMLEAVAALLRARGHMRTAADFAAPAEALINQLGDEQLAMRTRRVIVQQLAQIFHTDTRNGLNTELWMRELRGAQATKAAPPKGPDVYAPFEFIGIPSAGGRVCYVIDASDSMLTPISGADRRRLSRVVTGPGGGAAKRDALPWDRIHTRFDVAREYLKLSIRKLTKKRSFAIVLFGTDAQRLKSTPSLLVATPTTIAKVIKELDAIKPGPKAPGRPHGTLRGFTNLHGGLDLAFRLTGKALAGRDPYVQPGMLAEGVDTIFLLSDGDPSTDDYRAVDRPDAGDAQADPETRASQEKVPDVTFYGPYVDFDGFLLDDVRRMNLFRNAAIHCVGIGEADMQLLRGIAAAGLGEARRAGK